MSRADVIEVWRRPSFDPRARRLEEAAQRAGVEVGTVRTGRVVRTRPALPRDMVEALFLDPVVEQFGPLEKAGARTLTVARRPGVMDPVAGSVRDGAAWLGQSVEEVWVGSRVAVWGASEAGVVWLRGVLANPVVDVVWEGQVGVEAGGGSGRGGCRGEVSVCGVGDEALEALSRGLGLALSRVELRAVREAFEEWGREPTRAELETVAQTWSEHCKHKTFAGPVVFRGGGREVRYANLLGETIFAATRELGLARCWSVFDDNAGVVAFEGEVGLAVKVETHNHPSALDPYGGAGTGVGGVIRDVLGTGVGAWPSLNLDVFCVGELEATGEEGIAPEALLGGVVAGVRDYGNRMGVPTACGALVTHRGYTANPLVFCGTVGWIERAHVTKGVSSGDRIVVVGGRTGRDGIHGATFSSAGFDGETSEVFGSAVQIGDPIRQSMLAEVLVGLGGALRAVTDCGAGGLSSAVGELARGCGAWVDLARVPLKYAGLAPWEVWVSEAQERMVLAVAPERLEEVLGAFGAEGVEAVELGAFEATGRLVLRWGDEEVGALDVVWLHEGMPRQLREAVWEPCVPGAVRVPEVGLEEVLVRVLGSPTVASKEGVIRQYDHGVQGGLALGPLVGVEGRGPGDGVAVVPRPGGARAAVVGVGIDPRVPEPRAMAQGAFDEALRNVVAAGADPDTAVALDNFAWGDPGDPRELGALVEAAEGLAEAARAYRVPFVSGKDSLNNTTRSADGAGTSIPPTVLVTVVAQAPVAGLVSMDLKRAGSWLYVVGETTEALGGALALEVAGGSGGEAPAVDLSRAPAVHRAVYRAVRTGGVVAAHDLSEGGLAVGVAEMAFAGGLGVALEAPGEVSAFAALFAQTPTRYVLEVPPECAAEVEGALGEVRWERVGRVVGGDVLEITHRARCVLEVQLSVLESAWRAPLAALET